MGRGRPPLQREKPPAVVSDAGKSENSLSQSLSISTPEVKKRGRKRKICVENVENAPVNDVASSASTSSESERYVRAGHAACSGSSTSPHRRSDNLLDALSPYFCASAQRRRLHQRGEYAVLSGKHRREKHATPSKTLKRGRPSCTLRSTTHKAPKRKINLHQDEEDESKTPKARGYKASASCSAALLKKARNSRTVKRPRELKCSIMPVSTSMKSSKRSFGASAVRALAAQPVQVQRSSEDSRNAYDYMARFENPTDKQFYEEIYDEFQRQRAEQMDFIVGNRGKALPGAIQIGRYYIRTWYSSPYPQEYASQSFIFICPYCLHYSMTENIWERHVKKCVARGPPGDEIYRSHNNDETISIFEVDGNVARIYCQNLCLLSKLFLDSKTLFYDVEPFLFYVLTKVDRNGFHFVGYFSKEKYNTNRYQRYHLSCIMTLPCFQRKGYGRFLIDFSYLLARREEMPGTPERPLSELGEKSFRAYWRSTILQYFADCGGDTGKKSSLKAICEATGMTSPDVKSALKELKFLKKVPGTASHQLSVNWCMIQMYIAQEEGRKRLVVYDSLLKWSPKVYSLEQDYQIPGVSRPTESPTKEPEIIEKITKDKKQQRTAAQNVNESRSSSPTRTSAAPTPADEEKQPSSRTSSSLSSQSISTRCQSANEDQCNEYPECEESTTPIEPRPQSVQSNQSYTVNMGGDPDDNDDSPFVASNSEFPGYDEEERHQRSVCKAQPPQTNGIITHQNGTSTTEMPNLNSIGSNNCGSTVSDDDAPPRLSPIFSGNGPQPVKEKVKNRSQDDPNQMSISKQLSTSHVMPHPYMNGIHDCQTPYQMAPSSNAIPKSNWGSHERKESMVNSTTSPANSTLSARSIDGNIRSVDYEHLKSEFSSPQANDLSDHANSEKSGRSSTFSVPSRPDNLKNPPPQLLHPIMPEQAASSQQVPPEVPKTKPSSRRRNTLGTVYSQGAPLQPQYPNFNPMAASAYFPHGSHFAPPNYGYPIYANANPAQFHQATAASAIYPGTWSTQAQYAAQYSMHKQGMTHFPAAYYMAPPGAAMQGNGAHQPGDNRATQVPNGTAQNFTRYPTMDVNGSQSLSQFYNPSYGFVSANMPLNP
ncbi:hypothetical protein QR680_003450 [Steinernema hermaphroditum]|uniref:histone acetyltransferase n=1 Tax=Steinernema hermaphroditum TaxID=289476 RepID=A0AA39H6U1_9BILA|nr:hypothetical protein QR680_003450 [Steinernema hermaphroditum]